MISIGSELIAKPVAHQIQQRWIQWWESEARAYDLQQDIPDMRLSKWKFSRCAQSFGLLALEGFKHTEELYNASGNSSECRTGFATKWESAAESRVILYLLNGKSPRCIDEDCEISKIRDSPPASGILMRILRSVHAGLRAKKSSSKLTSRRCSK